jgi:uncharacterized protein (DUF1697 family)
MARHVVLLRGVNLARRNRIAMFELRAALEADGFRDVSTYVGSGNIVMSSRALSERVIERVHAVIKQRFGLGIVVIVRSHAELVEVVRRNPLAKVAVDPTRYLVTFASSEIPRDLVDRMRGAAGPREQLAVIGREVYSWLPAGVGRSPLWAWLAGKAIGITATSRNWTTVTTLLTMADHLTSG